jgi:sugar phosphate isomerase/epimerase
MNLSFSTLICPNWTLDQIFSAADKHGLQGIDFRGVTTAIDITRMPAFNDDLPRTLKRLASHNLQLPCFNTSIVLVSPAADRWEMMIEECRRYAALAEKTHTPLLRVFGGAALKGMSRDEALTLARRHLRQAMKAARVFGCRIAVETHDDWSTSDTLLPLLESFDPADVAVLWDIEHSARRGQSPADTAAALKPWIAHAHIKDSTLADGRRTPTLLGQGELPLAEFLAALKQIDYTGWLALETEKRWNDEAPDPEQSLPDFMQYMRKHSSSNVP